MELTKWLLKFGSSILSYCFLQSDKLQSPTSNIEICFLLQNCSVQSTFFEDSYTDLQSNWFMKVTDPYNAKFETGTLFSLAFLALYCNLFKFKFKNLVIT